MIYSSALYRTVDRISTSFNCILTSKLISIAIPPDQFFHFANVVAAFPMRPGNLFTVWLLCAHQTTANQTRLLTDVCWLLFSSFISKDLWNAPMILMHYDGDDQGD